MKLLLIPQKLVNCLILFPLETLNGVKEIIYKMTGNSKNYLNI